MCWLLRCLLINTVCDLVVNHYIVIMIIWRSAHFFTSFWFCLLWSTCYLAIEWSSLIFSLTKAVTLQGATLIEELEDAIFKNQRMPVSYSELAALKEGRFNASIQHRLAELEGLRGTHFCTFFADWFSGLHCFEQFFWYFNSRFSFHGLRPISMGVS